MDLTKEDPFYLCWQHQDQIWQDHSLWQHDKIPGNRYYDRGNDTNNVQHEKNCDERRLHYNKRYSNKVKSHNNPYSEDFPTFATYTPFSIFGDQSLTFHDFELAINYYNNVQAINNGNELYGPFDQHNYNQIGHLAYDNIFWKSSWKNYHNKNNYNHPKKTKYPNYLPYLKKVADRAVKKFTVGFNQSFYDLRVTNNLFHSGKNRIINLMRSSQTGWLRYTMIASLTRGTAGQTREFEFYAYYNPDTDEIKIGQVRYVGITTTDKILLPPGYDHHISTDKGKTRLQNAGRPLHPLEAKESELIDFDKGLQLHKEKMYQERIKKQPYKYDNSLPYWFLTRNLDNLN
jgi:hypothetical protein